MKARYLFPQDYMADPSAHVFGDRLYIYPSHDWDSGECFDDDGGHFQMKDYHVLSLDDVMDGEVTDHGKIFGVEDVAWCEKQLWDSDIVELNGKYYLVFSGKDYNGCMRLGVAIADRPEGPFKPLPDPIRGSYSIDPCVFKDDDGKIYTYFGRFTPTLGVSGAASCSGIRTTRCSKTSICPLARNPRCLPEWP